MVRVERALRAMVVGPEETHHQRQFEGGVVVAEIAAERAVVADRMVSDVLVRLGDDRAARRHESTSAERG